ncbi:hypothetical protein JKF63_00131 [Porcisia hertigi]|uniref:RanBP2-type domain-containing protein n=1 Tax=Porcisia hertigi TaxID=2761500 RepID=A0A836KY27_9TRYP|nr:hypothetical protein JKF63_00131 [Porcisia hertigi]
MRATVRTTQATVVPLYRLRPQPSFQRWRWGCLSICSRSNATVHQATAEEDMLARMLIQDAFHPPASASPPLSKSHSDGNISGEEDKSTSVTSKSTGCGLSQSAPRTAAGKNPPNTTPAADGSLPGLDRLQGAHLRAVSEVPGHAQECPWHQVKSEPPLRVEEAVPPVTDSRSRNATAELFATVRRKDHGEGMAPALEWLCSACHTYNPLTSTSSSCLNCKAPTTTSYRACFPPVRHVAIMPTAWVCQGCAHTNRYSTAPAQSNVDRTVTSRAQREKFICEKCRTLFGGVQNWMCPTCDHFCPRAATQCPTCYAGRPLSWTCEGCESGLVNSIFSLVCRGCGHGRHQNYSNSVVQCLGCREWNDIRWELCATCMAPLKSLANTEGKCPVSRGAIPTAPEPSEDAHANSTSMELATDTAGVLHSETVDKAAGLLGTVWAAEATSASLCEAQRPSLARNDEERPRVAKRLPDNAWWCFSCNVMHRRNVTFCDICLEPRDAMRLRNQTELAAMQDLATSPNGGVTSSVSTTAPVVLNDTADVTIIPVSREGDWQCPYCRKLLSVSLKECCGHKREVPNGYWLCDRCCSTNRNDRGVCLGCGERQDQVCPWKCGECEWHNDAASTVCQQCGLPHAARVRLNSGPIDLDVLNVGTSIACTVCRAPNYFEKSACYRCRARLREVEWTCDACGHGHRTRSVSRCEKCNEIRQFDLREEVWLCDVCSTPVFSGGEIPVRLNCPKCNAERAPTVTHYPCRWRCKCGLFNRSRLTECPECGARRRIESLGTTAICPHCFRDTPLDVHEMCTYCKGSLAHCFQRWESSITPLTDAAEEIETDAVPDDGDEEAITAERL